MTAETETPDVGTARKPLRQSVFRNRPGWRAILLAVLVIAAAAGAAWQYRTQYRSDVATDARVAEGVVEAARAGTVAILSYAPESLDRDFATARSHLSGDFLTYFDEFTAQVVRPVATEKKVKTTAEVTRAAVADIQPTVATVLVFLDQATTSTEKPDPVLTSSAVLVTLDKLGDRWSISGFDPV